MSRFGKSYETAEEYQRRLQNFKETQERVNKHNDIEFGRHAGFRLGINIFADWDQSELSGEKG